MPDSMAHATADVTPGLSTSAGRAPIGADLDLGVAVAWVAS